MRAMVILAAAALLATVGAGCVGDFRVRQTEPIRIQIDGESQESRIAASGAEAGGDAAEKQEFRIESPQEVEAVTVIVEVKNVEASDSDDEPAPTTNDTTNDTEKVAVIVIIVEDRDTNEKLAEREVEADDQAQVELNVDVKGRDNVVIVTQAVQGVADVEVAAKGDSGMGDDSAASPTTTMAAAY